jgi:hypothetical protein
MKRNGQMEQTDQRAAASIAASRSSASAHQQILDLARLLARIAARDAVQARRGTLEEE